jgi:hypothetical protein
MIGRHKLYLGKSDSHGIVVQFKCLNIKLFVKRRNVILASEMREWFDTLLTQRPRPSEQIWVVKQ